MVTSLSRGQLTEGKWWQDNVETKNRHWGCASPAVRVRKAVLAQAFNVNDPC